MKNGTFEMVDISRIGKGTSAIRSRLVDYIKPAKSVVCYKSGLVAQKYGDDQVTTIAKKALFIQRIIVSITTSLAYTSAEFRDIVQTYIPSRAPLQRDMYISPPKEMTLSSEKVLKVIKPLYGIRKSRIH